MSAARIIVFLTLAASAVFADEKSSPSPRLKAVTVGMSMDAVIQLCGRHFRRLTPANVNETILVYDDITVDIRDYWPGMPSGKVYSVKPTTTDITEYVEHTPYEDATK